MVPGLWHSRKYGSTSDRGVGSVHACVVASAFPLPSACELVRCVLHVHVHAWVGVRCARKKCVLLHCVPAQGHLCCACLTMCVSDYVHKKKSVWAGVCVQVHGRMCVCACGCMHVFVCVPKGIRACMCVSSRTRVLCMHVYCACMWIIGSPRGTQIRQNGASFVIAVVPHPQWSYHQKGGAAH